MATAPAASTTRLVRPPRLLGFGGRPYNFFDREALGAASGGLAGVLPGRFSAALLVEGPALVLADEEGNVAFTDGALQVALQHKLLDRPVTGAGAPRVLLARSRQSPPLMALCGVEKGVGGAAAAATTTVVVKTWVGSKLTAPSNVIDIGSLLKQGGGGGTPAGAGASPSSSFAAAALEPTALACNHDGTRIVVGFRSGTYIVAWDPPPFYINGSILIHL